MSTTEREMFINILFVVVFRTKQAGCSDPRSHLSAHGQIPRIPHRCNRKSWWGETILKVFCSFPGITLSCFRRIRQSQPLCPSCFDEDVFVRNDRKNDEEASAGVRGEDADVSNDGQFNSGVVVQWMVMMMRMMVIIIMM